jgi:hypothetical protein
VVQDLPSGAGRHFVRLRNPYSRNPFASRVYHNWLLLYSFGY